MRLKNIEQKIYLIHGKKVMLDTDLAAMYGIETKALKRAVNRNLMRFPDDFMFKLTKEEENRLRCQIGASKKGRGGSRYLPYAFTEQGVAMLSSVLNSKNAILVNIEIMRTFARIREMIQNHQKLWEKIVEMEKKYDGQFKVVFDALRALLEPPSKPRRKIGFH